MVELAILGLAAFYVAITNRGFRLRARTHESPAHHKW